jgi:Protein of unknown function (DUF429)
VTLQIIGIDCATQDEKIGLARGQADGLGTTVHEALVCTAEARAADRIVRWIGERPTARWLLALDAPLGWPADMGAALVQHRAGAPIDVQANMLFRRETDRYVARKLRKTPLDVGADRIARTAHAALKLLADVGGRN